jgi:hypothetical protein
MGCIVVAQRNKDAKGFIILVELFLDELLGNYLFGLP